MNGEDATPERRHLSSVDGTRCIGQYIAVSGVSSGASAGRTGMANISASGEGIVSAATDKVYRVIADYREHHPKFLPPAFSEFRVEEGGVGAGTIVSYKLKLGGQTSSYRVRVTEPEPGRTLTETDIATGIATTFTVTPEGDQRSRVNISTTLPASGGIRGWLERVFAPRMLGKLYTDELQRLAEYVTRG